jgi:hypothetical protein
MNEFIWRSVIEIELESIADFRLHLKDIIPRVGFVGNVDEIIGGGWDDFD